MGYCLNCLDEPVLIAVSKPLLTVFDIHLRLESCGAINPNLTEVKVSKVKNNIRGAVFLPERWGVG